MHGAIAESSPRSLNITSVRRGFKRSQRSPRGIYVGGHSIGDPRILCELFTYGDSLRALREALSLCSARGFLFLAAIFTIHFLTDRTATNFEDKRK
jgi:hypothetical protein